MYREPEMEIVEFDMDIFTMNIGSSDNNSGGGGDGSTTFPTMQTEPSDI